MGDAVNSYITAIQAGLAGLGFDPGPRDGLFGPRTRSAAEAWLTASGAAAAPAVPQPSAQIIYQGTARYPVREIVVHCAATRPAWMADAPFSEQIAEIRRWHVRDNGWKDIGYHWLISQRGELRPGRAETVIGAGVEGHNAGVIHVCLIGGHGSASTDRFAQHFTQAQDVTLRQQLQAISMRTPVARISGHNEWAAKACPGFHVPTWLKEAA